MTILNHAAILVAGKIRDAPIASYVYKCPL